MLKITITELFMTVKGTPEQIKAIRAKGVEIVQVKGEYTIIGDPKTLYMVLLKLSFDWDIELI